jgi:hypothetical protein
MATGDKRLIGRILLDGALITPAELEQALTEQQISGERLGEVLVRLKILDEAQIRAALAVQEHLASLESALKTAAGERDKLGLLLCKGGYLSEETLDDLLALQRATGEKIGEILVRVGIITTDQLAALLSFQQNQENSSMEGGPLRLGELLVTTGELTREQLATALEKRQHSPCRLGEILVSYGFLSPEQVDRSLHLQQKLVAASLIAILSMSLSGCGSGEGSATGQGDMSAEFSDPTTPGIQYRWSNYLTLAVDEYGLVPHTFYSSTSNDQFWSVQADIATDIHDMNARTVFRIHIPKNGTPLPPLNKAYAIGVNPLLEKFPGDVLVFNGQKSTYKKVESGTIVFTANSDAASHVQGTFDVIMTDYDASTTNPPQYRLKGSFCFRIGSYGPVATSSSRIGAER